MVGAHERNSCTEVKDRRRDSSTPEAGATTERRRFDGEDLGITLEVQSGRAQQQQRVEAGDSTFHGDRVRGTLFAQAT